MEEKVNSSAAFVFPGQGAQYVGMGRELYEDYAVAREVFDSAQEVLGFDLARICFEGPREELTKSAVCQPAILTHSIAALMVLKEVTDRKVLLPLVCAGLSLGEYSAMTACGILEFKDAVRLVHLRGKYMDEASDLNPGGMVCVLGLEPAAVKEVCEQTGTEVANLNSPGQVVVSGSLPDLNVLTEAARAAGAKRVIPLQVSGAFHSSLMNPAAEKLAAEIARTKMDNPKTGFIANVSAEFESDPARIRELLIRQVKETTRWEASVRQMTEAGVKRFLEIGPGKVLRGLIQKIDREAGIINLEKAGDFEGINSLKEVL